VDSAGRSVLTDPFDESVGYDAPRVRADVVLISHDHHDHNNARVVRGSPVVLKGPGKHVAKDREFRGIASFHDKEKGRLRGKNTIFCFSADGIRICHLGDLGHLLDQRTVQEIGEVDLLMIPVGGIFTIDAREAQQVVDQLSPGVVVPMHYKTADLSFELHPLERFLKARMSQGPQKRLSLRKEEIVPGDKRIVVLDYR
jgi:L-ascorbate metabolism protein UlaG (beta-lactamase superfamily)